MLREVRILPCCHCCTPVKLRFGFSIVGTRGNNRYARKSFATPLAVACRGNWNIFHCYCWRGDVSEPVDEPLHRERRVSRSNGKRNCERSAFPEWPLRANPAHRLLDSSKRALPSKHWRKSDEVDRSSRHRGKARSVGGICSLLAA